MEGFLPPLWAAFWFLMCVPFWIWGAIRLRKLFNENPELKLTVAISGGTTTITTTADGAAWDGVMDFDARTINIQFTLTDVGTSARQILILNEEQTQLIAISSVTPNSGGNALHKLALPAGTYKFKLQKLLDDTATDACRLSATITVSTTTGLDSSANTALNAWGNTFDATGDVVACKS